MSGKCLLMMMLDVSPRTCTVFLETILLKDLDCLLRQIDVLAGMKTPSSVNVVVHLKPSLDLRDKMVGEKFFHLNVGNMATDTQGSEHLSHTTQLSRGCCSSTNLEQAPQAPDKKAWQQHQKQTIGSFPCTFFESAPEKLKLDAAKSNKMQRIK